MSHSAKTLRKLRFVLGLFIVALVVSGITAFPLAQEMELLVSALGLQHQQIASGSFGFWIQTIHDGLKEVYGAHPWIAYGTDWLAFAHIIIAIFFLGPLIDPVRNVWIIKAGLIACCLVVPFAIVCGAVRGIPLGWRLIDCSFGVIGAIPLFYCLRLTKRLEELVPPIAALC